MSDNNPKAKKVIPIIPQPGYDPAAKAAGKEEKLVSLYAAHKKIYPRSVTVLFNNWRWAMVVITQLVFYGLPWIEWGQRQAVLFDLGVRRFYIFGLVLYPQDFIYLTGLLVIAALSLFLFTAVAGRLWCGYACPQTVYTEMFLWIEKKIEGDRSAHMRRDAQALSFDKVWRKTAKHLAWLAVALWTGFTFVGYFTPIKELAVEFMTLNLGSWEIFWSFFYSFATYGNAGFMREQVCLHMCPYARFQSVMFDRNTLNVAYDSRRGEGRGARKKDSDYQSAGLGDCIDCTLCVQVCPTGIDIRDGLQLGCISCGACIDACNSVMDKMHYPRGLVRYASENSLEGGKTQLLRPRLLGYAATLGVMIVALIWAFNSRSLVSLDVAKDRNLFRENSLGQIENTYTLKVINKTQQPQRYAVSLASQRPLELQGAGELQLQPGEMRSLPVTVALTGSSQGSPQRLTFILRDLNQPEHSVSTDSTFVSPAIR